MSYKRLINIGLLIFFVMTTMAQSGVNSPYTRYGFGQLSDQSFGNSKAMGGIAYGLRNGLQINAANPASYSAVDSLTFLFDAGMSLQNTNFQENGVKTNAKNSTIDYIAMQFRLWKRMGMTAGFLPYSSVGYNMSQTHFIQNDENGNPIEKKKWNIVHTNTEAVGEGVAEDMIDGDESTYWHCAWKKDVKALPHQIIVDLGNIRTVKGFRICVRDVNLPGGIKDFRLYGRPQFFLYE